MIDQPQGRVVTIDGLHVEYWDSLTPAAVFSIEKFVPLYAASADHRCSKLFNRIVRSVPADILVGDISVFCHTSW